MRSAKAFFILAAAGQFALFPLIFTTEGVAVLTILHDFYGFIRVETWIKIGSLWMYMWYAYETLIRHHKYARIPLHYHTLILSRCQFSIWERVYLYSMIPVQFVYSGSRLFRNLSGEFALLSADAQHDGPYAFLPLMLISVYCSIGVTYAWIETFQLLRAQ